MSVLPTNTPTLRLLKGQYFRNVVGSTTSAGIGRGDPFPANLPNWLLVYEAYTHNRIASPYRCPGCGNNFQRSELKGGHIVLGRNSDSGSAPTAIDLSSAAVCFRPTGVVKGRPWQFTYDGRMSVADSDRVFILPICTNCNNQGGGVDIKMQESKPLAHLICYGYTDDYVKYMNMYEGDFFDEFGLADNERNQDIFENNISTYVDNTITAWQTAFAALDTFDGRYLTASQPSQAAVPSMTTRSGHSYY
jgi:hypothetical protein